MPEDNSALSKTIAYMKSHWPSQVKPEWQVSLDEYPAIAKQVIKDFTEGKTTARHFVRIAGLSGSGKTTQILPAANAYFEKQNLKPALVAARRFVEYHPHYKEILDFYGAENLRKMTDEFSTIMMFLVLSSLLKAGYDVILDVTLLDPEIEQILLGMLQASDYNILFLMIATSPKVTEHFLKGRSWRHDEKTEKEFIRATQHALSFYAKAAPDIHIILWSVYDKLPVYDGEIKDCLQVFVDYSSRTELPQKDDEARRDAKIKYLAEQKYL